MPDDEELLHTFQPRLRYDSQEVFFADSAAEMVEAAGHVLRRAPAEDGTPGVVIAEAASGDPPLSLDFLRGPGEEYPRGGAVLADDVIHDPRSDLRAEAHELHQREEYRNIMYGAVRREPDTERAWLQYWCFYLYNDYNLAGGFGLHQGDWEMVQLLVAMQGSSVPIESVLYAQHRYAEHRDWQDVDKEDGTHPVVYVGRGSHASYFEPGIHKTEAWWDIADGERDTPPLRLEVLLEQPPAWVVWPGRWGSTQPSVSDLAHRIPGLEQPSPVGPGAHPQWADPRQLTVRKHDHQPLSAARPARVRRARDRLRVDFDFRELDSAPERLMVTINSRKEHRIPPVTETFVVDRAISGRLVTRRRLDPERPYDIRVSTQARDGKPSYGPKIELRPVRLWGRLFLEAFTWLSRWRHRPAESP